MKATTTTFPVVFIHGVFGFGKPRPMWNRWTPYWPEQVLDQLNRNHIVLHVGPLTSNHDRACEAFYQLYGGRVDYGHEHCQHTGHNRFGATFDTPLHPNWSASNPVHLVGHSFGATTSLELYQLLCADFFGVGSDSRWVKSIVSIAGPLTGSTMTHMVGVKDGKMAQGSPIYLLYVALVLWFKLYKAFPVLKPVCDVHLEQWSNLSLWEMLAVNGPVNEAKDLGVHDAVPSRCIERNARLQHLDKLHLLTVVSSPSIASRSIRDSVTAATLLLLILNHRAFAKWQTLLAKFRFVRVFTVLYLLLKLRRTNVVTLPVLDIFKWINHRHAKALPPVVPGCNWHVWGPNDGCVNTHSMLEPWFPRTKQPEKYRDKAATRLEKGRWYSWHVQANHFAGTYWDNNAEVLYRNLFTRIVQEYERDEIKLLPERTPSGSGYKPPRANSRASWAFSRNQSQECLRWE